MNTLARALARGLPLLLAACSSAGVAELPYLAQPTPGETPEPFAPGLVNTEAIELNGVFTPDGREFFFTRELQGVLTIFHSVLGRSGWSPPSPLPLYPPGTRAMSVDMSVSTDGTELYFLGDHAHAHAAGAPGEDLWVSLRVDGAWAEARALPPPVRSDAEEIYPVVVADGSLYFLSSRPGGLGPRDLYRAQRLPDGGFAEPVSVGPPISSAAGMGDTYVTPDERLMVFSSRRTPSEGRSDLFVSFRGTDGAWSEPVPLGPAINTPEVEFCPMLTPDRRYLFFSRRYGDTWETTTGGDVFWVDARVLERLRPGR